MQFMQVSNIYRIRTQRIFGLSEIVPQATRELTGNDKQTVIDEMSIWKAQSFSSNNFHSINLPWLKIIVQHNLCKAYELNQVRHGWQSCNYHGCAATTFFSQWSLFFAVAVSLQFYAIIRDYDTECKLQTRRNKILYLDESFCFYFFWIIARTLRMYGNCVVGLLCNIIH